jgi:glycyl-tRNA synthetase beta chain
MADFLLEIGLEEIPSRMIAAALADLSSRVESLLVRERLLSAQHAQLEAYSTPRRLAVLVRGLLLKQDDAEEVLTGPSWKIAFKEDVPTPAAIAFAKKAGVEVTALARLSTPKGEYVSATVKRTGRSTLEVLTDQLPKEIGSIYWPKNMYWRAGKPERFVRPLRWLLALLDDQVVPVEFAGITASNVSFGHRILHGDAPVQVAHPADYEATLAAAMVVVDPEARRHKIRKALDAATRTIPGAKWREDESLVDTVVNLTEWPSVLLGSFEPEYLTLPEEVLVTVMRDHQKYFAVEGADGKLAAHFLAVLNTDGDPQGLIRHGNERVLRARFNDARFFWNYDQKIKLEDRVELLKSVTFQKDLGSYHAKTEANERLATALADLVQGNGVTVDTPALLKAVSLAKTDLTAELVKEFTELQGIVGGLYARAQGHGETVSEAIYSQYTPVSMEDKIPATVEGQILGLADRMNAIVDMFAIGLEPTGSKDPFALRRAANGVIKILAESSLPVELRQLRYIAIEKSAQSNAEKVAASVMQFLKDRLAYYLREVKGYAYDVVNAVLASEITTVPDTIARVAALSAVRGSDDFVAISGAFKRIKNLLRQAEEKGEKISGDSLLVTDGAGLSLADNESRLYDASLSVVSDVEPLYEKRQYSEALEKIARLRPEIDSFFDTVMVMDPEPERRRRRLWLIAWVLERFSRIADFSEIVTEK